MDYRPILGATFVSHFTDADKYPLLVVGSNHYSYKEVCDLGVIQPRACRILSRVAKDLKVRNVAHFYKETSPYQLASTHGVGVTTLYVLLQLFAAVGLDVERWYSQGEKNAVKSFLTLKERERSAELRTKEDERKRRRLRSRRQVTESERALSHDRPRTTKQGRRSNAPTAKAHATS